MEKSSFFNSVNGDRKYQASDFAAYFSKFIGNGVFPNPSTNLQVIANNDMTVTVKAGPGWINGYMYLNDSDLILPIEVADGVLNRIDRIALRMDTAGRAINAVIKKGTFASSPVAPTLQRDADGYELVIADVYVGAGVTSISQTNITDKRYDSSLCGISSGLIQQVDVSTLFNQYSEGFQSKEVDFENEFNTWFDTIKNQLSGDVAGNLQNQINTLNDTVTSHEADYATDTGVVNSYKITLTPAPTSYEIGKIYKFKAINANTGASTFQIGTLVATSIKKNVSIDLASNDIVANQIVTVVYDGTNFQLLNIVTDKFIYGDDSSGTTSVTNIDSISKSGYYLSPGATTIDGISDWWLINHIQDIGNAAWGFQIASELQKAEVQYCRSKINGTWSTWRKMWTGGNLGIGAKVTHSLNQSIATSTWTTLNFNTESLDDNNMHDTITNNSRITCKAAGKYLIGVNISFATGSTGKRAVAIMVNGNSIASNSQMAITPADTCEVECVAMANLNLNDYVEIQVIQGNGGALNVNANGYSPVFYMVKVG